MDAQVEISEHRRIHSTQNFQRPLIGQRAAAKIKGVALVQKTQTVTHRAVCRTRYIAKCLFLHIEGLHLCHFPQPSLDHIRRQPAEIIALAA